MIRYRVQMSNITDYYLDITNQRSFLNAREWITSAKEVISVDRNYSANEMDSIAFILVGNKLDLAEDEANRYINFVYYIYL